MTNPLEYAVLIGSPAYDRDYQTEEALLSDWNEGKDFRNVTPGVGGFYFSIHDAGNASEVILSNRNESVIVTIKS